MIEYYFQFVGEKNGSNTSILNLNKDNYEDMKIDWAEGNWQTEPWDQSIEMQRQIFKGDLSENTEQTHLNKKENSKGKAQYLCLTGKGLYSS